MVDGKKNSQLEIEMNVKNGVGNHRNIGTYVYECNNTKIGLLFINMML